ncbi:MAG: oligoribonuclease [Actinomycetota bacterium]|nr:oligoribonuclease [Actinomycetota bacterium]
MANGDQLVWVDCEMTGLLPETDEIVEIACIVTDAELNELDAGISLVVKCNDAPLAAMDEFVVNMHTESGLIDEIPLGITLHDAEARVLAYVKTHVTEAGKAQLAGSSVYVDRGFLAKYMPELDGYLHYRLVDVSSIKELVRRWYPRTYYGLPEKHGNHRALGDIRESIAELRYYREAVFVAQPGPDSAIAKELGMRHVVDHAQGSESGQ